MNDRYLGLLGLCLKAKKAKLGGFLCEAALKSNRSRLIIMDKSASDNTAKGILSLARANETPVIITKTCGDLEKISGREVLKVISVNDKNFATAINKKYEEINNNPEVKGIYE